MNGIGDDNYFRSNLQGDVVAIAVPYDTAKACEYNGCHVCLLQESLTRCPTCGNTGGMSISSTCRCGLYVRRCFNIITRFTIRTECADEIMNTVEDVI